MPPRRVRPEDRAEAAQRVKDNRSGASTTKPAPARAGRPDPRFALLPSDEVPRARRKRHAPKLPAAARRYEDVVLVVGNKKYKQRQGLPPSSIPGVSAFDAFFSRTNEREKQIFSERALEYLIPFDDPDYHGPVINVLAQAEGISRHHRKRIAQHFTWRDIIIPSLVPTYFEVQAAQGTSSRPAGGNVAVCTCSRQRSQTVLLADWDEITSVKLRICECRLAADQLLRRGYFPCAPKQPSVAFSTRLLEFISIHSLNVAPNTTAWGASLQKYWARRGQVVEDKKTFRKRLGTALTWYQVLENRANMSLRQHLLKRDIGSSKRAAPDGAPEPPARKRQRVVEDNDGDAASTSTRNATQTSRTGRAIRSPQDNPQGEGLPAAREAAARSSAERVTRGSARRATVEDAEEDGDAHEAAAHSSSERVTRSSARRATVEDAEEDGDAVHASSAASDSDGNMPSAATAEDAEEELTRPIQELRDRCPICFGGGRIELRFTRSHVIVCIDANFAQKRRVTAAEDGAVLFAGSRFASPHEVDAMENEVSEKRKAPARPRRRGNSARLSEEVLNDCEGSFLAAQEKMVKASKNYYADTGLMALLCRHDRVLYVANMTSPGERQYYALALLRKLLQGLPKDWCVGVLYDIACQLSRSIEKWGFLEEFADRLDFAVSVFHAYGHQWACQLVFHPRKRVGFGMSDGEGCERFWSAIRCLISGLRVSGYHRRLFVLDRQMESLNDDSLWKIGRWFLRRFDSATVRLKTAEEIVRLCGEDEAVLEQEWKNQVESQLVKTPRQSSSAADKVIDEILVTMGRVDGLRQELKDERKRLQASHKMGDLEVAETTARVQSLRDEITAAESSLTNMRNSLGATARAKFETMRGDEYLRTRVNARALRATIRASLRSYKFERRKIERAFRHQLMQEKDHAQTRNLVHRREQNLNAQVRKFNALVVKIEVLVKQGKGPKRHTRLPRKLEARKLFRLDVDDDIWQEDPGLGPQDDVLPRWQTDERVKNGIVALLEVQRCKEELERLSAEIVTLEAWWKEEDRRLREFAEDRRESAALRSAVKKRIGTHAQLKARWQYDLRLSKLGVVIGRPTTGTTTPGDEVDVVASAALAWGSSDEGEEATKGEEQKNDGADEGSDDDRSSMYGSVDEDEEDDAVAEMLDELELGDGLASDEDEVTDVEEGKDNDGAPVPTTVVKVEAVKVEEATLDAAVVGSVAKEETTTVHVMEDEKTVAVVKKEKATQGTGWRHNEEGVTLVSSSSGDDKRRVAFERDRKAGKHLTRATKYWTDRFSCDDDDFVRMTDRTAWLSGTGLAVFADIQLKRARAERHPVALAADLVHPELFWDIVNFQAALEEGKDNEAQANKECVFRKLAKTLHPNLSEKWLVLSHIVRPQHWTLVELRWRAREIRFYDSFSKAGGYAADVEERTRILLSLCEEHYKIVLRPEEWQWIGEERPMRQTNGYDCGPFISADFVSLLRSGEPSAKRQRDMGAWREHMADEVMLVRNGMRKGQFGENAGGNTAGTVSDSPTFVDLTGLE
ncbi:hypothetical protein EXIGLDRAFT_765408 [Exidia glandulosa HHB12029]|uniref:Ubiquitin-like protease family profile domain-containing protein n=1 Tax=Exidia glandulosa HHB12029 TaxID=1314781 RepID=A0A165KGM4_EXIGL|nr:hypothetical protein EXIGLDRAFT_765408 [Exidia glandulosa HHB12029]